MHGFFFFTTCVIRIIFYHLEIFHIMKIKTFLAVFLFGFTAFSGINAGTIACECGEHPTGITTFTVDGDDCCTSVASEFGFEHTYMANGPAWELITVTQVSGSTAQTKCCG